MYKYYLYLFEYQNIIKKYEIIKKQSRQSKPGNLVLIHSFLHFPPNSGALRVEWRNSLKKYYKKMRTANKKNVAIFLIFTGYFTEPLFLKQKETPMALIKFLIFKMLINYSYRELRAERSRSSRCQLPSGRTLITGPYSL